MAFYHSHKSFLYTLLFSAFLLPFVISSPIPDSPFNKFIYFLLRNNCSMPNELKLPFPNSSDPSSFNYLSTPLGQCQTTEALKEYTEANMLCTEVFDVLKNITCVRYDESLPTIVSDHLSTNVCHDFKSLRDVLPRTDNYLSGRLSDGIICKILCTEEKFELLCKTLLWSYDTLMKIKHALPSEVQENKNGSIPKVALDKGALSNEEQENKNESITKVTSTKAESSVIPNSVTVELKKNSQTMKEMDKSKNTDYLHQDEGNLLGFNLKQTDQNPQNEKISDDLGEATLEDSLNKKNSPNTEIQDESINKTGDITKNMAIANPQNKSETHDHKLYSEVTEKNIKSIDTNNLSDLNSQPELKSDNQNKINVDEKLPKKEAFDNNPEANIGTDSLTFNAKGIKDGENKKNVTMDNMLNNDYGKNDVNSIAGAKSNEKSEQSLTPVIGNDNELKNNSFPEEDNKSKTKQANIENQEVKEIEKPKQTDYEGPNEVLPDTDSKLPEFSTQLPLSNEDGEQQEDKDQEQYNDIGNEVDYQKPEYDSFNVPPKNKESGIKNSIASSSNQMMNGYDNNISPKNNIAQMTEEIAMIAPFPEQEDSHFFFYFLSIVLVIMAGYLIFHNKQKIIALIVEGRHERRRRSHGAGYKKLETK